MPTFAAHLLIVPLVLVGFLAFYARRVNSGSPATQSFIETNRRLATQCEVSLDFLMMLIVAGFILAVEQNEAGQAIFVQGLFLLATVSVVMTALACIWKAGYVAMVVRMIAFRSILGLGLFTALLGYFASGL